MMGRFFNALAYIIGVYLLIKYFKYGKKALLFLSLLPAGQADGAEADKRQGDAAEQKLGRFAVFFDQMEHGGAEKGIRGKRRILTCFHIARHGCQAA